MQNLRIASVQFQHAAGDKPANFATMESFVVSAANRGVQILVFPECCITGYWFLRKLTAAQLDALAEQVPDGPSCMRLRDLAVSHRISIGAGLIGRGDDGRLFNSYVVALPDGAVHWVVVLSYCGGH